MRALLSLLGLIIDTLGLFVGRLLFVVILAAVLILMFAQPDAPQVPAESALVLAPAGVISEEVPIANATDLILGSGVMRGSLLHEMQEALIRAESDDRIRALVIDTRDLVSISPAQMEALGDSIALFNESGKPVYAWGESFNQQQYALASHADSIMLHPMGSVMLNGYGGSQLFFRDLLERMNVTVHVFRVG